MEVIFKGNGAVWDPGKGRILCRFVKGELKTSDEYIIKQLESRGYEVLSMEADASTVAAPVKPTRAKPSEELKQLKMEATERGLSFQKNWGLDKMNEVIDRADQEDPDNEEIDADQDDGEDQQ